MSNGHVSFVEYLYPPLLLDNYKSHDASCPRRDGNCDKCGYKYTVGDHDCVSNLKGQVTALELQVQQLKLAQGVEELKRVKCGLVFKPDDKYYACATCCRDHRVDDLELGEVYYCQQCFYNGDHHGHNVVIFKATNNRLYCDCGDDSLIKANNVRCRIHRFDPMKGK